jgi:putative N-acetylmannosamine-6-phosphate epimerase
MSELREKLARDLAGRLADWLDEKTSTDSNRPAIVAAIQDYAYGSADAVLRVLAEHGEVKNLREQITLMVWRSTNKRAERAEADLAAARQQLEQVRNEIAQTIIQDATSRPRAAEPFQRGMFTAADIARQYAKEPREEDR